MRKIYCLIFGLVLPSINLRAQQDVTAYTYVSPNQNPVLSTTTTAGHFQLGVASTSYSQYFVQEQNVRTRYGNRYSAANTGVTGPYMQRINTFTAGGVTYTSYTPGQAKPYTKVNLIRRNNPVYSGNWFNGWYTCSSFRDGNGTILNPANSYTYRTGAANNPTYLWIDATEQATMEDLLNNFSISYGTDNLFGNTGLGNAGNSGPSSYLNNGNNIERVDLIYVPGGGATTSASLSRTGFLVNERNGNDAFKAAAITALDANGNTTAIGPLITVNTWGSVGPSIISAVFNGPYGASGGYKPSILNAAQTISGVFITLNDLGVAVNQRIYGLALYPPDYTPINPADRVTMSNPILNTSQATGGLDMMSGSMFVNQIGNPDVLAELAVLGNLVWNDLDQDGIQDAGEPGLAGVIVTASGPAGNLTTTTAADGSWRLDVPAGTYNVLFTGPTGYVATASNQGTDDQLDSDPVDGAVTGVTLAVGTVNNTIDAGFYRMASLSGNVFNDGNGASDATVNTSGDSPLSPVDGTNLNGTDGPLYVSLVNSRGTIVATVPVSSTGAYTFSNVAPGTYATVLTTNASGSVVASLPIGWNNTGEQLGTVTAGQQFPANGILTDVVIGSTDVTDANFGINAKPVVEDQTADTKPNPGSDVISPVSFNATGSTPGYAGTDVEDDYPALLTDELVTLYPATGGTLYYDANGDGLANPGEEVNSARQILNFDPTKVFVDPTVPTAATTVTFDYAVTDAAGILSDPKTVTVPFDTSLPVALASFTGKSSDGMSAILDWTTTEETNSDRFEVQHSTDGKSWTVIGNVASKGKSKVLSKYHFVHTAPSKGDNLYRLRMVDFDHTFAYSKIVNLNFDIALHVSLYPNPAANTIHINTEGLEKTNEILKVEIYDLNGKVVFTSSRVIDDEINIEEVPAGAYVLSVMYKKNKIYSSKIIVIK